MFKLFVRLNVLLLAAACITPTASAAGKKGPKPPPRSNPIRALIVTGGHPFKRAEFFKIFDGHPDIVWQEVQHPKAAEWFSPDKADEYDVMVWYDLQGKSTEAIRNNLTALFKKGKPLVALHHCNGDYADWDESLKIIGARYNFHKKGEISKSSYYPRQKISVKIADPKHPVTRFMKDFELNDETYKDIQFAPGIQPLLTTDHANSDKVIAWTHTYSNSPVVGIQPGHGPSCYQNENYRRLVIQSIRWLAGRLPDPSEEGFVPLFNGKNFDGWTIMGKPQGFSVTPEGTIRSTFGKWGGWMRTNKEYSDFILRVEWKVAKRSNSGVFIRASKNTSRPWEDGSEIQISNRPRDIAHCTGSVYGVAAVDPRPDESYGVWHEFEIQCNGPKVKVFADNIPIVDVDGWQLPALGVKPLKGYIGLQDAHEPGWVEFRNIRVKELPPYKCDKLIWRLGIQAYTFRKFTLFEAIEKAKALPGSAGRAFI